MNWEERHHYLLNGDYENGWPYHEEIWSCDPKNGKYDASTYGKPIWNGDFEPITLLINAEFGDGDTLAAAEGTLIGLHFAAGHADFGRAGCEVGECRGGTFSGDVETHLASLLFKSFSQLRNELGTECVGTADAEGGLSLKTGGSRHGQEECDDGGFHALGGSNGWLAVEAATLCQRVPRWAKKAM